MASFSEKTDFVKVHKGSYYDSDFDSEAEAGRGGMSGVTGNAGQDDNRGNYRRRRHDGDNGDDDDDDDDGGDGGGGGGGGGGEYDPTLLRPSVRPPALPKRAKAERKEKERRKRRRDESAERRRRGRRASNAGGGKRSRREDAFGQKKQCLLAERSAEGARVHRFHVASMDAYSRHKKFINDYMSYYGGTRAEFARDASKDRTDLDVIRENHRFLWSDDSDSGDGGDNKTWERKLAKRYYDKLYKEYCITDLSRYKENKVALRWRMEKEVVSGKGQFVCGEKSCPEKEGLKSWEVNFGYVEQGEKKNALVKVRLCPDCSYKLNYHHQRREIKPLKNRKKLTKEAAMMKKKRNKRKGEEMGGDEEAGSSNGGGEPSSASSNLWQGPAKAEVSKSRDEEFESYFEDMFL